MSDLSRTVLAGTSQVKDAYSGLVNLNAVNRQRKERAMAGIGDNLAELGKTIKEYGSWRDAKAAEDEITEIENADALALNDPQKRFVTLGAVKVRHAKSAAYLDAKKKDAWKQWIEQGEAKKNEAMTFHYNQQTQDLKDKAAEHAQNVKDRQKWLEEGGASLPVDATEEERATARDVEMGVLTPKEAAPIFRMHAERRKRIAEAAKIAREAEKPKTVPYASTPITKQEAELYGDPRLEGQPHGILSSFVANRSAAARTERGLSKEEAAFLGAPDAEGVPLDVYKAKRAGEREATPLNPDREELLMLREAIQQKGKLYTPWMQPDDRAALDAEIKMLDEKASAIINRNRTQGGATAPTAPTPEQIKAAAARGYKPDGKGGWVLIEAPK